ncbi:uncharacterized protein N7469_004635 [Penicillium citrinum]|uniref:Serine peptidase n=1 Tax=Penicillium citrinum TaxID=5077 RepID=A0A9W9P7H3_PENCI|nr:uncharacterized protein N7469_004635 [Penicillium citrinum]KAJ5235467.1 hypothetical protein N7469_004635 [Penicillium citrinum]
MHLSLYITTFLLNTAAVHAAIPPKPIPPPSSAEISDFTGQSTFQQLIDHKNPQLGTFSQRYWWNSEWWSGEGSPVVLFNPGEQAADGFTGYLKNKSLTGVLARELKGAVLLLEHRYWGDSSPYDDLTTENLQYLTLENSIADLTYFANNVKLPFDTNSSSNAQHAPWVLSGGSYSGALSAWTESTSPGTFWAYHASSAPVQAIYDFWQYFTPVKEGMPQNCSRDISRVMEYIDSVGKSGSRHKIQKLKNLFGLGDLEYFDDFASALENGPWLWQSNDFTTGYSEFYQFCDYVENAVNGSKILPGPDGVGLGRALNGYAQWFKKIYLPGSCTKYGYWSDNSTVACYDTHNASSPMFTDRSVNNTIDRQWQWFLCNEPFSYWQDAAPSGVQTLVSRTVNAEYWQRQCPLFFPEVNGHTYGSARGKTAAQVNSWTKGWDLTNTTRLIWTNGQFDPWRDSGVSSIYRPGGPLQSTSSAPINVIPGGFHCSDLLLRNGAANKGVQDIIDAEVAQIKTWVQEFYD